MKIYTARMSRFERGWELHVDGVGVPTVRTLERAEQQARDLIGSYLDAAADDGDGGEAFAVELAIPVLEDYRLRVTEAQRAAVQAAEASRAAAAEMRAVVMELRWDQHLSVSDVASVLGVSRGRVSQLAKG